MILDEIYRWITHNVPYFREKGGELTSSGWKVYHCSDYARQALLLLRQMTLCVLDPLYGYLRTPISSRVFYQIQNRFFNKIVTCMYNKIFPPNPPEQS